MDKQFVERPALQGQRGFTLVEIMVSSLIFSLCLFGITAMLHRGTEIEVTGDHRRQARSFIHAAFEQPEFGYSRYRALIPTDRVDTVILDAHSDYPIEGYLNIRVSDELTQSLGGKTIPYKEISMALSWNEVDKPDSVVIVKQLAVPE